MDSDFMERAKELRQARVIERNKRRQDEHSKKGRDEVSKYHQRKREPK